MAKATKSGIEVLYQVDSGISDPARIAEILPNLGLKEVRHAMAELRKSGLIKGRKDGLLVTEKGREALKTHKKWILG